MAKIKVSKILCLLTIEFTTLCISVNGGYLGCYKESVPVRHFLTNPGALGKSPLTPQICYTLCGGLGHDYAALGFGRFCFCSDSSPDPVLDKDGTDLKCSLGCPGNPTEKCGSAAYVSVYRTPKAVELTVGATPKTVPSGDNVLLAASAQPSDTGFDLSIDFGDYAGRTIYAENGTNVLQRMYHQAGVYEIKSYFTDIDNMLPDVETATSVVVESIPDGVSIDCLSTMATYEEDVCFITVTRGTNMNLEISYTDGNPGAAIVENLQIADCTEYSIGNFVQEHMPSSLATYTSTTSTNGLIVHHGNPAQYSGVLVGFEYYGVGTGALDFYVYRANCGAGQVYCYNTNMCQSTCGITCGVEGYCMASGSCCGFPISRSQSLLSSYTLVHTISVSITPGYGYAQALPDLDIEPGDVIAHDGKATPLIANSVPDVPIGTVYDQYCSGFIAPASIGSADCSPTTEVHQLKAIYAESSNIVYPLEFTMPGSVTFQATLTNQNFPSSAISITTPITVLEGVNAALLNVPVYVALNTLTTFSVESYTGSPANVSWNFDPALYDGTDLQTQSHSYTTLGSYNLTVNISNAVSYKFNFTTIYVEELITGLIVNAPTGYVEVGVDTNVDFGMTTGSDYICDFEFLCEGGIVQSVQRTEADGFNFNHNFNIAGDVTINVNCSNNLGSAQKTGTIRAVERLTNVALTPQGAVVNKPFHFMLTWTAGTDVNLDFFEYDGQLIPMTVDESLLTASSDSTRTETVTAVYTVSYQLTNPLGSVLVTSTSFTIEIEITNALISCTFPNESPAVAGSPYRIIPLNTDVECTVSMDAGTGVVIVIDYNDGSNDTLAANPMEPWASAEPGFSFPITHTFADAGYYQMTVTVSNAFNGEAETYPIAVMVGVENSVMNSVVSTVRFDPPAVLYFNFNIIGPVPNDVRLYIDWGDNNNDEYYPCDLTDVFNHTYMDKDGTLTLTYRLENLVSTKEDTIPVYIVTPIIGMECFTSGIAGSPGEPIDLVFKSWRGPGPNELNLTYDCDTSVAGVQSTKPRQYISPDGEDTESCTYSSTGPVTMSIQAVSRMEDKTCYHNFEILNPVTEDFDVFVPAAPMDSEFNTACALDYNIVYDNSVPFPDDAEIVIDYNDTTNTTWGPFPFNTASLTHHYEYPAEGHYISKIRIYNDASEVIRNILTGCYASFSAVSIDVKRTPLLPLGSSDDWGFGVSRNVFRGDEPIRIYPYFTTGTFLWWEVTAVSTNNTYSCNHTERDVITLNIEEYGVYTITVIARNPLHTSLPATYVAEIMRPVDNLTIMEVQQTAANEDKYFDISMVNYGTAMCVAVNYGDGAVELYGDSDMCSNTSAAEAHFTGASFKTGILTDVSQAFTLQHRYTSEGTYVIDIYAWNSISDASADLQFAISGLDCSAPNIDIRYRCRDFRYPMAFLRSKRTKITGITDIACPNTLRNTKLWTLFRVNQTTNTILYEVGIADVPSSINSELAFNPLFLQYGVYLVHYTVTMLTPSVDDEVFSSVAETYIEIVPSPLVAELFENSMSLITVGSNELLTLAPKDHSYDPDVDTANGDADIFDTYSIACRDKTLNETFPDESVVVTPRNVTGLPALHTNTGGCFQSGPGWFKNFDGSESFLTSILEPDHLYEFKVIVRKAAGGKEREATVFGQVHVKLGSPPSFNIDFKIPLILKTSSMGKFFNPNNQLGMLANLTKPLPACSFQWEMFAYDHNFCGEVFNCWRNLSYLTRYIEGAQSEELTVHTKVFEHYPNVNLFQLRLTGTDDDTGVSGVRIMNLTRNRPPEGGNCTISPTNGTAMETNFTIECPNFTDKEDHEIVGYKLICTTVDGTTTVVDDPYPYWEYKMLPVGDPDNGYVLRCNVTVTDELGSEGTYAIPEVTVGMMPLGDFRQMLKDMTKSSNDMMDMIEAVANLADTSSFVSSMVSMVYQLSENDENEAYVGQGTFLSFTSTGLGSTAPRVLPFTQFEDNIEKKKQFEKVRDRIAQMFTQAVDTLWNVTVESPSETLQLASTLSGICASKAHLTRNIQGKLTDLLEKCQDNVLTHEEEMSVEEVESISQNVMDCCSNIGESAAQSADRPTDTDRDTQSVRVRNFDSSMDSSRPNVYPKTDRSDENDLREGKGIYNKEVQTAFTAQLISQCEDIQETFVEILARKQPKSPNPIKMSTPSFAAEIYKNDGKSLENRSMTVGGCSVSIPPGTFSPEEGENTYLLSVTTRAAPNVVLPARSSVSTYSRTLTVTFKDANTGEKTKFKLTTPMTLSISRDPNAPKLNMSGLPLANPVIPANRYDEVFFYHQTEVFNEWAAIRIQFRLTNGSEDTQLLILVNYIDKPKIDETRSKVVHVCTIPSDTSLTGTYGSSSEPDPHVCFVPAEIVANNTGIYSIAVRQLHPNELNMYKKISDLPTTVPTDWKENKVFTTDYTLNAAEITCRYFDDGGSVPKLEGVVPSILSSEDSVVCMTDHLTTFAGGWAVAPNTIDWNFIFSNADFFKNPTLYITEIVIALAYIIAMIWARRKDRQDLEKLGLAPLLDNDPRDKYYYEIMVSTGMRRGAGTESKVHFILSGEEEETEVRTFEDKKRQIFTRGSTDGFLMSVPESIGALNYLRIWHDNSGKGRTASWYLNHVVVRDVQTDKKYYFIANRWFAVEEDDGQVDRVIPVAGKEQMTEFSHLFAERATKNLSDGHLWFSVVARPPQSRFTRCQRVSCCLCLLYTSMLANAMFYGTESSDANAFQFGPFALTSEQIFIGVMANLIIFPVNFLLITLFRKSRPRKLRPSRVEEAIKSKPDRTTSMADVNPRVKSSLDYERPGSSFLMETKRSQSSMSRPESSMTTANVDAGYKKKKKRELPWWFTIISWILLWIAVLVSAAFVTFYGIMFQDIKCKKWITSMLISFFTSVFFTQPIKVFLFAIIFSLIIKNPGGDEDDDDEEAPKRLDPDEEYLHDEEDEFGFVTPRRPMYKPKPPDTKALEAARKQRLKEIQMWSVIREILFYAFFLWILLVISYRNVSVNSFNYKHNMQKVFILTNDTNKAFSKVKNTNDFWVWAKSGMLRGLRAGPYYNNFPPFYMRGYINDKQSRLMGYAILRQVRTMRNTCKIPSYVQGVIDECNGGYDIADEEDKDHGVGWTSLAANNSREEYKFMSGSSLDSFPYWGEMALYGGGGYVVKLNKAYEDMIADFDQLESEGWIDKYTRAVFLEFTVYNPSINLFSVSTLLAEFLPSGGVFTSFRFEPCNLLPYMNPAVLFQIICEIIYFAFTVFFVFKEIRFIIKQKKQYFLQFWNLVDLGICAMSVTAIVIYFYRLFCINTLTEYFKETHGNEYMKFQYVGYWSEIFNYIIGFLVFFATLKFLKLLRFNKKISMLSDTLRNSSKDLIHFSIIFNVVFLAFMQVFYLVFMSHLDIFKTFLGSCEAGIVMMMGKFDIYNMLGVNQWLTQIFIFLFVVTVTFIVVNMLLSILNDTFSAVRSDRSKQQNDYEIVDFMLGRFKTWTGIGRDNTTISPSEMEERNKNYRTLEGQIDYFPDQIDRFLASISNMYMGDAKFDDFLQKGMAKKMAMKAQAQQPGMSHPAPRLPGALRISNGARGMTDVQTD